MNTGTFCKKRLAAMLLAVMLLPALITGNCFADEETDDAFADLITELEEEGIIPKTDGLQIRMGDYEDSYANINSAKGIPLFEAENFVLSTDISWKSASTIPNFMNSGCGLFFNVADGSANNLTVSLRMDGRIYFSGSQNYSPLNYGNYQYSYPSLEGGANLTLVVIGNHAMVYLDGERSVERKELPSWGNAVGLVIFSGTNQDYGIQCSFGNINVYTWE